MLLWCYFLLHYFLIEFAWNTFFFLLVHCVFFIVFFFYIYIYVLKLLTLWSNLIHVLHASKREGTILNVTFIVCCLNTLLRFKKISCNYIEKLTLHLRDILFLEKCFIFKSLIFVDILRILLLHRSNLQHWIKFDFSLSILTQIIWDIYTCFSNVLP